MNVVEDGLAVVEEKLLELLPIVALVGLAFAHQPQANP